MEFHQLGKQCFMTICKQLDFLPFLCSFCGHVYCKEHYPRGNHDCSSSDHTLSEVKKDPDSYLPCSYENCRDKSAVSLNCSVCLKHFCIEHRYHGCLDKPPTEEEIKRFNEPKQKFAIAKSEVESQVSARLQEQVNKKWSATARKVQLMKLKGKAKGTKDIPVPHRLYFLIFPPLQCNSPSSPVYISNEWTVGRVIDSVADLCKIPNKNNEAIAPKIRIFKHSNGGMLSPLSKTFQSLVEEGLVFDGDKLILEYVPESDLKNDYLINVSLYKE